jgi:DNA-binding LacI/PurR family transcriptional regulator
MPSLNDVARAAGVSIATVSRAISHPELVKLETQTVVGRVMQDLGYRPSRVARRLRQRGGKRHLLGLLIPEVHNTHFAEIARGVESAAYANQFAVILCNTEENPEKEDFYLEVMRSESVDGIIVAPLHDHDEAIIKFVESGIPAVCVDRRFNHPRVDQVVVDNRRGAFDAVEHLIVRGHRRIGMITGLLHISTGRERKLGYEQALLAHGLPVQPELLRQGDNQQSAGLALAEQLLSLPEPPSALFISNNLMAVGAMRAIHARGLRIPQDVAIISFDDTPWAEVLNPPLSVVRQPTYELGRAATDLLLQRLTDPKIPVTVLELNPQLILRDSC